MARFAADRVVVARAPSAYGCGPTQDRPWPMVRPPRVGRMVRVDGAACTVQECARKEEWTTSRRTGPDTTPVPSDTATAAGMSSVKAISPFDRRALVCLATTPRSDFPASCPGGFAASIWRTAQVGRCRLRLRRHAVEARAGMARRARRSIPSRRERRSRSGILRVSAVVHPRGAARAPLRLGGIWVWFVALAGGERCRGMWIVGVRDWRCYVLALTSPVVLQGLMLGNLTALSRLPLALAWRYRDRTLVGRRRRRRGRRREAVRLATVVWLVLTKRYRAAAWAVGSAVVLVLGRGRSSGSTGCSTTRRCLARRRPSMRPGATPSRASSAASAHRRRSPSRLLGRRAGARRAGRLAVEEGGQRPARIRGARRRRHRRVTDRLAELRLAALRADSDHVASPRPGLVLRLRDLARRLCFPTRRDRRARPSGGRTEMAWELSHAVPAAGKAFGIVATVLARDGALVVRRRPRCGAPSMSTDVIDSRPASARSDISSGGDGLRSDACRGDKPNGPRRGCGGTCRGSPGCHVPRPSRSRGSLQTS